MARNSEDETSGPDQKHDTPGATNQDNSEMAMERELGPSDSLITDSSAETEDSDANEGDVEDEGDGEAETVSSPEQKSKRVKEKRGMLFP